MNEIETDAQHAARLWKERMALYTYERDPQWQAVEALRRIEAKLDQLLSALTSPEPRSPQGTVTKG